ncbi:MAG: transporter ATP-binding protein [Lachnospiraceae bacterium]|nr:transporter ATP-binding protein [Lachnospiraceae bacterium]
MTHSEQKVLLKVEHLTTGFVNKGELAKVVDDISFHLVKGEILGIVGESGSGKTMTALSIMGLLSKEARIPGGSIAFEDRDLLKLSGEEFRKLKGNQISMIFQEPMTSLNPVMTVGRQIEEMLLLHEKGLSEKERKERTMEALREAELGNGETVYPKYPHQLSGGMRQRVMIAMAMICRPKLLIADEPTTALDVTIQGTILNLIQSMNQKYGTAVILISHDLSVIKKICARALVMQDGVIVEQGTTHELFLNPRNDYTKKLIAAMPSVLLDQREITKEVEKKVERTDDIEKIEAITKNLGIDNILEVNHLNVYYEEVTQNILAKKRKKQVVYDATLHMRRGEILGIVGESGSGKSTIAKSIVGLIPDRDGAIVLNTVKPQMVFQDPYGSLNPVKRVDWILEEPLKLAGGYSKKERKEKVAKILKDIGLQEKHGRRFLSQLSGGQRQRVAIGVALIQNSKLIVLDEPVSALDVTVQSQILELLRSLRKEYDLSYLFISHDLNVIYLLCDRVCVMHQGRIVETADMKELFHSPKHPYTKKLLEAVI